MKKLRLREPFNGISHLVGAVLSLVGLAALIYTAVSRGTMWHEIAFPVFGVSMVLLYTASALYHLLPVPPSAQRVLRKIDHMMIFVLIAGTYTPFCLVPLRGPWGWSLLIAVWSLAVAGFIMKVFWMDAPRWLTVTVYVSMGSLVIIAVKPLLQSVPLAGLAWLGIGGLAYMVGAVFYATKWPNPFPGRFGFHEIWHLFVMMGTLSHFWAVLLYV